MKILVIFTGGTIGSSVSDGYVSTDEGMKYALLERYNNDKRFELVTCSPYTVLSENLSANELNMLQKTVSENLEKDYGGIIITHGTDTMQYTSAALEYAFCGCDIPIVVVSAAYPLEDERTNGFANFEAALEFIVSKKGKGVFVSYRNGGESAVNIHVATHILQHGECSADVYSIDGTPYAVYDGEIRLTGKTIADPSSPLGCVEYYSESGILVVDSRPGDGFNYSLDGVRAVVLKPYHSATLNTENKGLIELCKRAREREIPVFAVNVKGGVSYESTKAFEMLGIAPLPYGTYVSAYMKLWAGVSLGKELTDFAALPIGNELVTAD